LQPKKKREKAGCCRDKKAKNPSQVPEGKGEQVHNSNTFLIALGEKKEDNIRFSF